jgi:2-polyprenyl-3-methyl-5-hydroxy-6-metoxy-1,4-benzoquinol methylase
MTTEVDQPEGIPERFSPEDMAGQLLEAEHIARYRMASTIAAGKKVLDAGCGTAYGSAMLGRAGAESVVGVDIAESVLQSVRGDMPENVELIVDDLSNLALEDDRFDLVVCFEVIEHFHDPQPVLDNLVRVLAPDGVMLVSSPNRGVYPAGNPYHFHEFKPDELEADLRRRVSNVRLIRQQSYVTAAILADDLFASADTPMNDVELSKLPAEAAGDELFTLAIAGEGELPEIPSLTVMTSRVALDDWLNASLAQDKALREHRRHIQELESKVKGWRELEVRLTEAEHHLGTMPQLLREVEELRDERDTLRTQRDGLLDNAQELQAAKASLSWRVTRPLREGKVMLARFGLGRR